MKEQKLIILPVYFIEFVIRIRNTAYPVLGERRN